MAFLSPKVPKPDPAANPVQSAVDIDASSVDGITDLSGKAGSLISTTARGLKRKASTARKSLIGG